MRKTLHIVVSVMILAFAGCDNRPGVATPSQENTFEYAMRAGASFVDPRDSTAYPTVYVGTKLWMAKNLNYDTMDGRASWCPGGLKANCATYGRLYAWRIAARVDSAVGMYCDRPETGRGICPVGWHLPTLAEWNSLSDSLGGLANLGRALKGANKWNLKMDGTIGAGKDSAGFGALPAGYWFSGDQGYGLYGHTDADSSYFELGSKAGFWTMSSQVPGACSSAWSVFVTKDQASATMPTIPRTTGLSIRCVRD